MARTKNPRARSARDAASARSSDAEHDREDWRDDPREVEPERGEPRLHPGGERGEPRPPLGLRREDVEGRERGAAGGGRERGREDEGPRARDEQVDEPARAGDVGAEGPERLAESPHLDVDAALDPERLGEAGAGRAEHPRRVRLVHVEHRAVPLAGVRDLAERRRVAVHPEDGVGHDELPPRLRPGEEVVELADVEVPVADELRAREEAPVHDRGVVQHVAEDGVPAPHQRGRNARVHVVAGVEEERGLGALERGEPPLEGAVDGEVTRDEPRRPRPRPLALGRLRRRAPEPRVRREGEVVVRAQVHHRAAVDRDDRALRRGERLERAPQPLRRERVELAVDPVERRACHRGAPSGRPGADASARPRRRAGSSRRRAAPRRGTPTRGRCRAGAA